MKTVKSFHRGEYGVIMVSEPEGTYRIIAANSQGIERGFPTTYSKATEEFDKFVESVLAEKEVEYAPV